MPLDPICKEIVSIILNMFRITGEKILLLQSRMQTRFISFGGIGSPKGWTTVLARSALGYEIFNEAVDNGYMKSASHR